MFKNYLTVAIRNLIRHRVYSVINISGLAVGMACCILILLLIQDELSYDRFHDNADRIHRVIRVNQRAGQVQQSALTPAILAPMLKQYFPQLAQVVRFMKEKKELVEYGAKRFYEDRFFYADPEVFEVFSFPLLRGDPERALVDPYTVLITDATARKYFGDDDPIGKTLKLNNRSDYRVTGILRNLPHNSHLKFDFLASSQGLKGQQVEAWYMHGSYTYALLPEQASANEFQRRFPDFVKQHVGPRSGQPSFILQPLRDVYLHSDLIGESGPRGNIQQLYIFAAVSF